MATLCNSIEGQKEGGMTEGKGANQIYEPLGAPSRRFAFFPAFLPGHFRGVG